MTATLRVFVSSVQKELEDERLVVRNLVNTNPFLSAPCVPVESIDNLSTEPGNLSAVGESRRINEGTVLMARHNRQVTVKQNSTIVNRRAAATRKSHRWYDNCRGRITSYELRALTEKETP